MPIGIVSVGCFIVAFMTLSMNSKPSYRQTQVAEAIINLVKQPSATTGRGQGMP